MQRNGGFKNHAHTKICCYRFALSRLRKSKFIKIWHPQTSQRWTRILLLNYEKLLSLKEVSNFLIEQKIQKWRAECQVLPRNDFKMFLYVKFTDKF